MKVVHITTVHNPFDTRIFEKMCKSAVAAGWDVTLIASHDRDETIDGVKIKSFPRQSSRLMRAALSVPRAIRLANSIGGDIYHIHDPELLLGLRFLSPPGVAIYDMHEHMAASIRHKSWIPRSLRLVMSLLWRSFETALLNQVPVIFAERSYQREYPWVTCSEIVLNMPKSEQLAAIQPASRVLGQLTYVGTVSADRGSLITLRALELLQRRRNDVKFLCIGPANRAHQVELETFVSRAGLQHVRFLGRMRSADAWRLAAESHIGLATLLPKPNYVESYPTKLFEYMSIGLPVVASNFPLYREIVEAAGCGICVDPESPEEIAAAIAAILEDPRMAAEMGTRGQEAALQRFRWDIEAKKLGNFYARVLTQHGGRV